LNRFSSWHKATLRGMARSLLIDESIRTTLTKAKAVKPFVEKLISSAKANDLAAKRRAFAILGDHALVSRLFNEIAPRFSAISGGYTRIINLGRRRGDDASVVIFELTRIKIKEAAAAKKHKKDEKEKPVEDQAPAPIDQASTHEEKKHETQAAVKEKPPITKKPTKKFLGGIRNIFKKERDSL